MNVIKKAEAINNKSEEVDNDILTTKKKMNKQNKYLKDLGERELHLNNEYINLLEK